MRCSQIILNIFGRERYIKHSIAKALFPNLFRFISVPFVKIDMTVMPKFKPIGLYTQNSGMQ